jgi:hypothetical protein
MFKIRKRFAFLIALTIIFAFMGCNNSKQKEPPEIKIQTEDGITINYIVAKNKWDGKVYDREDILVSFMKEEKEILYLPLGSKIKVEFETNPPFDVKLQDRIMKEDGSEKYNKATNDMNFEYKDGNVSATMDFNPVAMLSSDMKDYEKGAVLRGFIISAKWDKETECEYGFAVYTDADS